jgi:TonB family protein
MDVTKDNVQPAPGLRLRRLPAWLGLGASALVHVGVLAAMPGLDTAARCPVMLLTHIEPEPAVLAEVEPPRTQPLQKPSDPRTMEREARHEARPVPAPAATAMKPEATRPQPKPADSALPPVEVAPSREGSSAIATEGGDGSFVIAPPTGGSGDVSSSGDGRDETNETPAKLGGNSTGESDKPAVVTPPAPPPPAVDLGPIREAYKSRLYSLIAAAQGRHRPDENVSGTVRVSFTISPDGSLASVSVSSSSGYSSLDEVALATVRDAAGSFPAFPSELPGKPMKVGMNLKYRQID